MKILTITYLLCISICSYAQIDSSIYASVPEEQEMGWMLENYPEVEGGIDSFRTWLKANNRLINKSDTLEWEDFVAVQFWVDTTGILRDIGVIRGIGYRYDKEAYRLINECPLEWRPGNIRGKKIAVRYTFPIRFVIND